MEDGILRVGEKVEMEVDDIAPFELFKLGGEIRIDVEGLDSYHFDSKSFQYDLGMLQIWFEEQTGQKKGVLLDKAEDKLRAIWGREILSEDPAAHPRNPRTWTPRRLQSIYRRAITS